MRAGYCSVLFIWCIVFRVYTGECSSDETRHEKSGSLTPTTITTSVGVHRQKRKLLDFFAERPEKDSLKCCVCSDSLKVSDVQECAMETHKIVRDKMGRRKSGKKCKDVCKSFGRTLIKKEDTECDAFYATQELESEKDIRLIPPPCESLPLPQLVSRCCACSSSPSASSSEEAPSCFVPTRKVFRSRLGTRIGGSTCNEACSLFGRAELETASTDGFCTEALCALSDPLLESDVFPMKKKGLMETRDRFDVVRWTQAHFVGALLNPYVVAALQRIRADVDDPGVAESDNLATVVIEQSGEERANFYISSLSDVKSFVVNAMKYGATLATLSHHVRLGMILAHASGAVSNLLSHIVFPLHIPLTLFTYIVVPWSRNVQQTMAMLEFSPKVVAITSCTEHHWARSELFQDSVRTEALLSDSIRVCGDSVISSIRALLTKTKDAILEFLERMHRDASCIAGDFSSMHRKCFSLIRPSLTGLPDGLWTEFALRLEVFAMMVDSITVDDCCSELSLVRSLFGGLLDDNIRANLKKSMRDTFVLRDSDNVADRTKLETACSASVLALSVQKSVFEAFVRTSRDFFARRARSHWRMPSLDFGEMDGSFTEGLTTIHPCSEIFNADGTCSGILMRDVGLTGDRACVKARDSPLWYIRN